MMKELKSVCLEVGYADPSKLKSDTFRYIDISAVDNIAKKIGEAKVIPCDQAPSRARKPVRAGDVIVATTRPTLNAVAMVSEEHDGAVASTGFCVLRANEKLNPAFLFHFVRSDVFVNSLSSLVTGALYPAVSDKDVLLQKIPLPSPEDQHRIAAELDEQLSAIDEARMAAERRVAAAEALEAALFREHFHGLSPVMIGLPKDAAPTGWKWTRLLDLAQLESGHTPSRRHPEWWGGDIPWIALPDIRALDGKVAMETKGYPTAEGIANSSARILPKDTVVFGRDVQVGFTTIMGRPMATSQHFFNWVCGQELNPRFLMHALRASKTYMEGMSSGAIHQTIYMPAAREFHFCHPTRKAQEILAATLDTRLADAATLLTAARAERAAIRALPAAALRRVFGEGSSG